MTTKFIVRFMFGIGIWVLLGAAVPGWGQDRTDAFFTQHDKNGDGKLTKEELPERIRRMFERVDANSDGFLTKEEDRKFRQRQDRQRQNRPPLPTPTYANVTYGPHVRNVLDIWPAQSETPTPLVIYYHGGGFRGGDKRTMNPRLLNLLLQEGFTVAAANYRLSNVAPFPAQMHDCARALQYLRHYAKKYNMDPKHVGATGGSAGAGISMWLAFHDDLADKKSKDPIARESTRISAAVVYGAQSSYDPRFIQKLFNTNKVDAALIPFFGMKRAEDVDNPKFHPLFEEASVINHLSQDDVPVLLYYPQANEPLPPNSTGTQHIHHPQFGFILKEKMDKYKIECVLKLRKDYPPGTERDKRNKDYVAFFRKHLSGK
jgi:acetyl esterase/lipase